MNKKILAPCALGFAFLFSATACTPIVQGYGRGDIYNYDFEILYTKKRFSLEFTPKRDLEDVVITFELYSQDETLFKKYNKHLFTTFERTIDIAYANEPYLIKYELDKDIYPDKIISDVEIDVEFHFLGTY